MIENGNVIGRAIISGNEYEVYLQEMVLNEEGHKLVSKKNKYIYIGYVAVILYVAVWFYYALYNTPLEQYHAFAKGMVVTSLGWICYIAVPKLKKLDEYRKWTIGMRKVE